MEDHVQQIGEAAGRVWRALEGKGEGMTPAQLKNKTELGADLLHQALGWLAREDKIRFLGGGKSVKVALQ